MASTVEIIAAVCLVWSAVVFLVEFIGICAIFRHYSNRLAAPVSPSIGQNVPHVTIIRPAKGLEPQLYECIASTFRQNYPTDKFSLRLCVESMADPAYPVLEQLVDEFPNHDAVILIENEDPVLHGSMGHADNLGPNPKIRNISRAYREAKGDIIWIVDCNVWIAKDAMGHMVDRLMGYTAGDIPAKPFKFVHQLPLVVDTVNYRSATQEGQALLTAPEPNLDTFTKVRSQGGGRLDELFMGTTHAKFYAAINTVGVAPCIVGKSNMFRKSHLEQVTDPAQNPILAKDLNRPKGVDHFSHQICEDHLIGDLLWRSRIPGFLNHGIVWGELVIQPMAGMSVVAYAARRARWLRARKLTVLAATLVEPGVESFLCCAYFAYAVTTLSWFEDALGIPSTWKAMGSLWLLFVTLWMSADWYTCRRLHSGYSMQVDENTPFFARGSFNRGGIPARSFVEWFPAWLGRETLALPIWVWAVLMGSTVSWRGKTFKVKYDTTVVEIPSIDGERIARTPEIERASSRNKRRVD